LRFATGKFVMSGLVQSRALVIASQSPEQSVGASEAISVKDERWLLQRDCFVVSLLAMTLHKP
jgi:hypothetical protein